MSVASTAKRRRKQMRIDPRYKSRAKGGATASYVLKTTKSKKK